jgi:uncharacterized 2Fe-2S/4Fe-4S cluster protein (DUF4445 family)
MRATDGAIEAVSIDADTMRPKLGIIGADNQKPAGVCGSGLIDAVCELFRTGIIDARGKFQKQGERVVTDDWDVSSFILAFPDETENGFALSLSEADIDNFIRAKASVFSAIRTLLVMTGMDTDSLDHVYIAGGIGSGIDIRRAVRIGMLPDLPDEKYSYIGNSSLAGAYALLVAAESRTVLREIARGMTYIELSSCASYMDEFIAACFLPHTDASLFPSA